MEIGTSVYGNRAIAEGFIGTANGNREITEGWVGTESGNRQFYSQAPAAYTISYTLTNVTLAQLQDSGYSPVSAVVGMQVTIFAPILGGQKPTTILLNGVTTYPSDTQDHGNTFMFTMPASNIIITIVYPASRFIERILGPFDIQWHNNWVGVAGGYTRFYINGDPDCVYANGKACNQDGSDRGGLYYSFTMPNEDVILEIYKIPDHEQYIHVDDLTEDPQWQDEHVYWPFPTPSEIASEIPARKYVLAGTIQYRYSPWSREFKIPYSTYTNVYWYYPFWAQDDESQVRWTTATEHVRFFEQEGSFASSDQFAFINLRIYEIPGEGEW